VRGRYGERALFSGGKRLLAKGIPAAYGHGGKWKNGVSNFGRYHYCHSGAGVESLETET